MIFLPTLLQGAYFIDMEKRHDSRGYFARTMCGAEFEERGLVSHFVQTNHSHSVVRGTLRGMHFQRPPHMEAKLVRCVRGAIYDVIVDLREGSPTYLRSQAVELSAMNGRSLYVPEGFAHGFQTLADNTDVIYAVSHPYSPAAEAGVRYDDATLGISWPEPISVISERDAAWPPFRTSTSGRAMPS